MRRSCSAQYSMRSGTRAIAPSSRMISQTTPDGLSPASRARSTAASVWPARLSTPPGRAFSGWMWPEWMRSCRSFAETATWIVRERWWAEIPVVTPSRASIVFMKAVPSGVSLCSVIGRSPSSSQRSSVRQTQISPRACVAMKLTASGVANCAAITRSPSFSRSGASTTTTNLPWRMSSIASSMVAKGEETDVSTVTPMIVTCRCSPTDEPLDVLGEHVRLEVDLVARLECAERRHLERVRDQRNRKPGAVEGSHGERDAVDADRALLDAVAQDVVGGVDPDAHALALGLHRADPPDGVDMTLDVVAAERLAGAQRRLDVYVIPGAQPSERRPLERLGDRVEGDAPVRDANGGEADAVDGHRVAGRRLCGGAGRLDGQADAGGAAVDGRNAPELADDAGEHATNLVAVSHVPNQVSGGQPLGRSDSGHRLRATNLIHASA